MKQSLKLGLIVLVVALLAMSGLALAQDGGSDADDTATGDVQTAPDQIRDHDQDKAHDGLGFRGFQGFGQTDLIEGFEGRLEGSLDRGALALGGRVLDRAVGGLETLTELLDFDQEALMEALADGSSLSDIAEANGVDTATLVEELTTMATDALDQAVTDGVVSQERADEIAAEIPERIAGAVERSFDGRFGRHGHHHHPVARGFIGDEVSELLGLSKAEIHELIQGGQTLSDIAADQGVDPETFIDQVTETFRGKFSDRVYGVDE